MYFLLETKGAFYCHVILPEDNGMDRVTTCKELAEVTPVGTQDGKEQRPAAIKSQPVPATTLRESHSSLQEKTNKGSHTLTWGTECWWFFGGFQFEHGPKTSKNAPKTHHVNGKSHPLAKVKLKAVQGCRGFDGCHSLQSLVAMLPGRPTWEMTKKYIAIGKWRTYFFHCRGWWSRWEYVGIANEVYQSWRFYGSFSGLQEFAECDGLLFPSIVPLFAPWLTLVTRHMEPDLSLNFTMKPPRLCDISLANCTNALAIDSEVASWLGVHH